MAWGNSMGGNYAAPILDQINRTGDIMQYGDQARRRDELLGMQKQQNAFQQQMQGFQLEELKRAQAEKLQHENAFTKSYPLADPSKDPEGFARLYIQNGGKPEIAMKLLEGMNKGGYNLKPGEQRFNASGVPIATNSTPSATYDLKETDKGFAYFPKQPGSPAIMTDHRGPQRKWEVQPPAGGTPKIPIGYRVSIDGQSLEPIPGGPADKPKTTQKAPAGYRFTESGDMEVVPGGPADVKSQINIAKDIAIRDTTSSELDRLAAAAKEIMDHPGLRGITGLYGRIPNIPGSDAANAEAKLNTLKSQTAFSVLQTMRNNSKTGGALGQVSDKEGELLQNNLAALDKAQSYEAYKASLQKIIDYANSGKNRVNSAFGMQYGNEKKAVGIGVRNANDFLNKFE